MDTPRWEDTPSARTRTVALPEVLVTLLFGVALLALILF